MRAAARRALDSAARCERDGHPTLALWWRREATELLLDEAPDLTDVGSARDYLDRIDYAPGGVHPTVAFNWSATAEGEDYWAFHVDRGRPYPADVRRRLDALEEAATLAGYA